MGKAEFFCVAVSLNDRVTQAGRDLWMSPVQCLLKAGSALSSDQVAQAYGLLGLENLQGQGFHRMSLSPL